MSAAAAVVAEPMPATAYMTAPAPTQAVYMTSQPAQVMSMPQQVYAQSQPEVVYMTQPAYTLADGQTVMMAESQMIGGSAAAPMTYEYTAAPATMYAAPSVYNISPERFAQIAAGIPLTQQEIDGMLGGGVAPQAPVAMAEPGMLAAPAPAEAIAGVAPAAPAAIGSAKADKKSSKKKSSSKTLKASSKKKKAGCC